MTCARNYVCGTYVRNNVRNYAYAYAEDLFRVTLTENYACKSLTYA